MENKLPAEKTATSAIDKNIFQKTIEFPDNLLMIDLCGQLDSNLSKIEIEAAVQINRRGNFLDISGFKENCEEAVIVLQRLYATLESGEDLEVGDIDAIIRLSRIPSQGHVTMPNKDSFKRNLNSDSPTTISTKKKLIKPRTQAQNQYIEKLIKEDIIFGVGPAGTGKTFLAVAVGVSMYLEGQVERLILTRPAVEAGERLGFLPGDMKEKVDPYMQPLYDSLSACLNGRQITKMMENKLIEIAPLAFMRGRTLADAFIVLDEAQNATSMQMKMFLTRIGERSRMAITGDTSQVDLPIGVKSGLVEAVNIMDGIEGVGVSRFSSNDVVRHPMVTKVVKAYEKFQSKELNDFKSAAMNIKTLGSQK